jgi:hypothetical protein
MIFSPRNIDEAAEDVAYEEAEFGFEIENGMIEEELELDEDLPTFSTINRLTTSQECKDLSKSTRCIVELEQLKGLASIHIEKCSSLDCAKSLKISTDFVGSALYLKWVCFFFLINLFIHNFIDLCLSELFTVTTINRSKDQVLLSLK